MRQYWLVSSGTSADPLVGDLMQRYRDWLVTEGDVQGFSRRPCIAVGDVLVHRAVGSPGDRLVAIGRVAGPPVVTDRSNWPWRLPRELLHVCSRLELAPGLAADL